jgi:hypothetical protein
MKIIHALKINFYRPLLSASLFLVVIASLFTPVTVYAAAPSSIPCDSPSFFFLDSWSSYLCGGSGGVEIDDINDFTKLAFWAVDSLLKLSAYIAAGFIVWGGIKYIKAQGDASQIASAKNTIVQALVGMVICIASVAIVQFVGDAF